MRNETTGPLQQHLHLNAGQAPTYPMIREIITEYCRTTTAFARLQQQASSSASTNYNGRPAPMDISATRKGKGGRGKGYKGYKGKQQSKGYKGTGKGYIWLQEQLRQVKRTSKRKTSVGTSERSRQRTRKEQRSQQPRKRKEPNGCMLQMWPTRSLGQRL